MKYLEIAQPLIIKKNELVIDIEQLNLSIKNLHKSLSLLNDLVIEKQKIIDVLDLQIKNCRTVENVVTKGEIL